MPSDGAGSLMPPTGNALGSQGIYCLGDSGEKVANYAYFPILVNRDYPISRYDLYQAMKDRGFTRGVISTR